MTIEYSDASWNVLTGCMPCLPLAGCHHCYAAREAGTRLAHITAYAGLATKRSDGSFAFNGHVNFLEDRLDQPLRKTKPQRYFVCSTSDPFYEGVKDEWRDKIMAVMLLSPWHTYLLCTKRPEKAYEYLAAPDLYERVLYQAAPIRAARPGLASVGVSDPTTGPFQPWIWWGTSAERPKEFEERVPWLRRLPVARRWLSLSPLLEEIPLDGELHALSPAVHGDDRPKIDFAVLEGESGPNARPCDCGWLRRMISSCKAQGTVAYLKQLGEHSTDVETPNTHTGECSVGESHVGRRGHAARDEGCWPTDLRGNKQLPEYWQPDAATQFQFQTMASKRKRDSMP
jgi:protein gp37